MAILRQKIYRILPLGVFDYLFVLFCFPVENIDHCDFIALRNLLIRYVLVMKHLALNVLFHLPVLKLLSASFHVSFSFRTHMQDLIDVTNDVLYENFRSDRLSVLTGGGASITRYDIL